ncbi:MAG: SDR family NAD(P)-dependent oxidoreductase, partial [Ruegeria sp.]
MADDTDTSSPTRRSVLTGAAGLGLVATAMATHSAHAEGHTGSFAGKTAFVTGAARGIGLACAEELAKGGANVVIYDIAAQPTAVPYPLATPEDLAAAKSTIEGYGVECLAIAGDVREATALAEAVEQTIAQFGSLDFLIVNAGITQPGRLGTFTEEQIKTIMDIN